MPIQLRYLIKKQMWLQALRVVNHQKPAIVIVFDVTAIYKIYNGDIDCIRLYKTHAIK